MKKNIIFSLVLGALSPLMLFAGNIAFADCGYGFEVGASSEYISGCSDQAAMPQINGFLIDIENNKITLNNYNGGAIYYFCRGTCQDLRAMEIELIGDSVITSESSSRFFDEGILPSRDVAFVNIVPTFTGSGTLKIKAGQPFAFEKRQHDSFSIDVIGAGFEKTIIESPAQEVIKEVTTVVEKQADENQKPSPSFFDSPTGIVLLVAVPSVLVVIIAVLLVALLARKNDTIKKSNLDSNE